MERYYQIWRYGFDKNGMFKGHCELLGQFDSKKIAKKFFDSFVTENYKGILFKDCDITEVRVEENEEDEYGVYCTDIVAEDSFRV